MRRCPVRRSVLVIVLLLSGPLALGGFAPWTLAAGASQAAAAAKILRIGEGEFPPTLDPHLSVGNEVWVSFLDYEGLTRLDEEMNTVPAAAESWGFSPDGTVVTFHLREHLTYADGSPLVAERFRYAVERTCDPRTAAPYADFLFEIVGCEAFFSSLEADPTDEAAYAAAKAGLGVAALDDRTLEIRLTHPAVYFPSTASSLQFSPVQQEIVERDPAGWWRDPANRIGNGPFRVAAIEPDGSPPRIRFAANERYWGGRPKLDGIEYVYLNDSDAGLAAYRRGELDMAWPANTVMPMVEADPTLSTELLSFPRPMTWLLNFNLTKEPFTDKKVREAFAYAFDRAAYCRDRDYGHCTPTLSWIPPGMPGSIETDAYVFDPAKARQALADSSYGGPERLPEIRWYYVEIDSGDLGEAEWLAGQYRQVLGVELTLVPVATYEEIDAISPIEVPAEAASWQLGSSYWFNDVPDPHGWLGFWTCGAMIVAKWIGYCNPAFDALVARSDAELDPVKRLALAEEAQRLLVADVPAVFLANPPNMVLVKPYVTGYSVAVASMGFPGSTTPLTVDLAPH